jgi:hypothetical protein
VLSDNSVHVIPNNDLREHVSSADCWCRPSQDEDEPLLWVHHSMDQRETYEQGRKPQ